MVTKYRLQNILAKHDNIIIGTSNRPLVILLYKNTYCFAACDETFPCFVATWHGMS
jgi:hypothetical protein